MDTKKAHLSCEHEPICLVYEGESLLSRVMYNLCCALNFRYKILNFPPRCPH